MAGGGDFTPEASPEAEVFRFSTDAFRDHERVAAWREVFGRTLLNIDIAPRSPDAFHASATIFRSVAAVTDRRTIRIPHA